MNAQVLCLANVTIRKMKGQRPTAEERDPRKKVISRKYRSPGPAALFCGTKHCRVVVVVFNLPLHKLLLVVRMCKSSAIIIINVASEELEVSHSLVPVRLHKVLEAGRLIPGVSLDVCCTSRWN